MNSKNEKLSFCMVKVTGIGVEALRFCEDKMLILFCDQAGNGVEDYSIQITMPSFTRDIATNDIMEFGSEAYKVTAVGAEAMKTLRLLGHCTLRFDGSETAALPGSIHLHALHDGDTNGLPKIEVGEIICFY